MKTFFGFTTGVFTGLIAGVFGILAVLLVNDRTREYLNEEAKNIKYY